MKTLNGIVLPESMEWATPKQSKGIVQSKDYTIGGTLVVYAGVVRGGRGIQLVATEERCWVSEDVVDSLIALANTRLIEVELNWDDRLTYCMFDHEANPAVAFKEVWVGSGEFIGTINLIESR